MSRIPPNLLYISIYNPTLQPSGPTSEHDDDAEEQAHILFYTAKERAVSRDRMLRQIGLAKALVNFSAMFNPDESCSNIHSQTRRMVVVSPEPDFWIHACVELGKTPKASKSNDKTKSKPPDKGKSNTPTPLSFDYHDNSVHDIALREELMRGYEKFKLSHGSFASILSTLGREALELQLERFWTVWSWSWYIEGGYEFGEHLGVPLHPLYQHIQPLLEDFSTQLPHSTDIIAFIPPYTVPSSSYMAAGYPSALAWHLLPLVTPRETSSDGPPRPVASKSSEDTLRANRSSPEPSGTGSNSEAAPQRSANTSNFLGIPGMNMPAVNAGVRKWTWPGYLTFGKSSNKRSLDRGAIDMSPPVPTATGKENQTDDESHESINAPNDSASATPAEITNHEEESQPDAAEDRPDAESVNDESTNDVPKDISNDISDALSEAQESRLSLKTELDSSSSAGDKPSIEVSPSDSPISPPTIPHFARTVVHLAEKEVGALATRKRVIPYVTHPDHGISLAFVGLDAIVPPDDDTLEDLAKSSLTIFQQIQSVLEDEMLRSSVDLLPPATKILQPKDRHTVSLQGFTLSSPGFSSPSEHLFHAQALHESDLDISEVFSRGQNPQEWHIGRLGLTNGSGDKGNTNRNDGAAFLEVFRKEASLTDVDNTLAGILRKVVVT